MNTFLRRRALCLLFSIVLLLSFNNIIAQALPKTVTTSFTGFPTRTFELQTDNLLYETTSGSPVKLSNVLFSNITFDRDEFTIMQCTRQSDGIIIGYELRGSSFMETLHTIVANGVSYSLKPNRDIYHVASNQKIGDQADYIRNENNHFIKVAKSTGNLFLYKGTPNTWEQVKQIVTLKGVSYILKTDNSLWAISLNYSQTLLGQNCQRILSNDKNTSDELIVLSTDGTYKQYNWTSQTWCTYTPNVLSSSPLAYEPGIYFVIQNQSALNTSHLGIKANSDGSISMATIPATGSFDEFLWTTEKFNSSYRIINKKFKTVLDLNTNPQTTVLKSRSTSTTQLWKFNAPNVAIYGINAFTITNNANSTVLELQGSTVGLTSASSTTQQTWVVQPMDLVTGYRLPFNLGTAQEQVVYNKILKIPSGPFIYGTNTVTEWGVLMAYFVVQNMINAEKSKNPAALLQNHKVVIIGKNDTYPAVGFYPIISGREQVKVLRGFSSSDITLISEELTGRSGVVNSFVSEGYRKTDHITHEFGHTMDISIYNWNGTNTIPNSSNAYFNGNKVELVAASVQAWFDDNSDGSYPVLPQTRQEQMNDEPAIYAYMAGKFNETNIWKPALQLRDYPQPTVTGDPLVGKSGTAQTDLCNSAHVTPTPEASINPPTTPLCGSAAVSFTLSGTPDGVVIYSINGGNGNSVTLVNGTVTITINNPSGNQTLQLISVADASGIYSQNLSALSTVVVNPTLTPTLSAPNGNCVGSSLFIAGASTASHIQWQLNGSTVSTTTATSVAAAAGSTVAGTGTAGIGLNALNSPQGIFVDGLGNIFIADQTNHRVQKWAPGATTGVTVAGGNGAGNGANQLNSPYGIVVDPAGNIYISDQNNHRVQKWAPGATSGITVAGGNGSGTAANQLSVPRGIFIDAPGNIHVADYNNHRIQKWAPGATSGTTVAGINGFGGADNQLGTPNAVFVDANGNIFVAEQDLYRVKKFPSTSVSGTNGVVVASASAKINGFHLDGAGNMYVSETTNNLVKKYPFNSTNSTTGTIIAGGNGSGNGANQLNSPSGVFVDGGGNIFIADQGNHRVQKWVQTTTIESSYTPTVEGSYTAIVTTYNGCAATTAAVIANPEPEATLTSSFLSPVCGPADLSFTISGTPDAIVTYSINDGPSTTATLTGGISTVTISGASVTQTLKLISVENNSTNCVKNLDATYTIVVYDAFTPTLSATSGNCEGSPISIAGVATASHIQWQLNGSTVSTTTASSVAAAAGSTVAGTGTTGSGLNALNSPQGIFVDGIGNIFIADQTNHRVQKWVPGATTGITVAGGNGAGNNANQLNAPYGIFVDPEGNLYISDYWNHRVQMWAPGATSGITVAGGNGGGNAANQLSQPKGIYLDATGNIYIADYDNHRIQKWAPGVTEGTTVAGGNGFGIADNQLGTPNAVSIDAAGNIFVAEQNLNKVKRFPVNSVSSTNGVVVASATARINGFHLDGAGNMYVSETTNNQVRKYPLNSTSSTTGTIIAGGNGSGNGANQFNNPTGLFVDGSGNIFIADQGNHRVQKWAQTTNINTTYSPTAPGNYTAIATTPNGCTSTAIPAITIFPVQQEIADGIDNNCNGVIDENSALHFDGMDDYVTISNAVFPAEMTFGTWLKLDSKTSTNRRVIFAWRGNSSALDIYAEPNGTIGSFESNSGGATLGTIPDNEWHHYAVVRGSGTLKLYIDGIFAGQTNSTSSLTPDVLSIGAIRDGQIFYPLAGTFDELRVWNYAKTLSEIQADVNCPSAGPAGSLLMYFDFNEGVSNSTNTNRTKIFDYSGNNKFGTLNNFALNGSTSNFVDGYLGAEVNVKGNNITIYSGDATPSTTDNTNFGTTCVGTPLTKTFTIENLGTKQLTISSITINGGSSNGFSTAFSSPVNIAAGGNSTFTVTFTPSNQATFSDVVKIASNDCDEALYTFAVSGSANCGTAAPDAPTVGAVTQPTCSTPYGSFTITNYDAAFTYNFSPTGPTISGAGNVTAPSGTYTITATNNGQTSAASAQVTVNAQPASPATPTTGTVTHPTCTVATGSFSINNFNAGFTYTFSPSGPNINGSGVVTAAAGSYRITATQDACTSAQSNLITVNVQPTIPSVPSIGTVTNPSCSGQTGSFSVTNYNALLTYTFTPTGPTINGTGVVTAGAGNYTITATNDNGCSASSGPVTVTVTDNQPPTFSNSSLTAPPALALANVPEASGYSIIFEPNITVSKDYKNSPVDYLVNNSAATGVSYNRVAYFMQLDDKWVWVSMDKFNNTLNELGLPNAVNNNVVWQRTVNNMNVVGSSNSAVTNGTGLTGNIEMWHSCYSQGAGLGTIPAGTAGKFDFNDVRANNNSCYGSFQVHNYSAAQTLFAYNAWEEGGLDEMGIGNNPDAADNPDWTFARNIADYTTKKLYILVNSNTSACPGNITVTASNRGGAVVNYTTPVGSDNCSGVTTTRTAGLASGATFPVGTTTVTHRATDAAGNISDCSFTVTVEYTNLLPIVSTTNGSTIHTEGSPVVVDAGITLSDADNTDVVSASVSITEGFNSAEDELQFTNQNGITGTYNAATGVLSLTGSASVADYQAVLASITYNNNSANPNTSNRTISFVVNDGTDNSTAATKTLTVTAVNDAPTLNAISNVTIAQNAATQIINIAGITDGGDGGQTLAITATSDNPALVPNPTITYSSPNATGSLSFTPVSGASGTATITVTVSDDGGTANGGVSVFTRTFVITVNAAPITAEALDFGGANDQVTLGDFGSLTSWSVETWFKYKTIINGENLFHSAYTGSTNGGLRLELSSNSGLGRLNMFIDGAGYSLSGNTLSNDWHHAAVVYNKDNNTLYSYLDGDLKGTYSLNKASTPFTNFILGRGINTASDKDYNGKLDEFRIWNKALSLAEITSRMNIPLSGNEADLLAYYNFNQGAPDGNNSGENILRDLSPNNINGTLTGFALSGATSNWISPGAPVNIPTSSTTDYFRSIITGNWNNPNTWESSSVADFTSGVVSPATSVPNFNASTITIGNGHTINVTTPITIDQTFVEPGATLKVNGTTLTVLNNGLTVRSAANGSGSVGTSTGSIVGNVTVERFISSLVPKRAYRLVTAPLRGSSGNSIFENWQNNGNNIEENNGTWITAPGGNVGDNGIDAASPGYTLQQYNLAAGTLAGVNNTKNTVLFNNPPAGTAANNSYFIFVRGDRPASLADQANSTETTTLRATGSLQLGNQAFPLNSTAGGFTLIGNPYAAPVNFVSLAASNPVIQKVLYFWDANRAGKYQAGGYISAIADINGNYNFNNSAPQGAEPYTTHIQSGQAFFVVTATGGENNTLTFNESHKSGEVRSNLFRSGLHSELLSVKLELLADGTTTNLDGTLARYNKGYEGTNGSYNAPKFSSPGENVFLFRDGKNLSIESRPLVDNNDTLFLRLSNIGSKNYQFTIEPAGFNAPGLTAFLEDAYLETSTPLSLSETTNVQFAATSVAASRASNRFMIVYKLNSVLPVNFVNVKAYKKQAGIQVDWNVGNELGLSRYEIERSVDGRNFDKAGSLNVRIQQSQASYTWVDKLPFNGINYYRIKAIDQTGSFRYSQTVQVSWGDNNKSITVYPNPVRSARLNLQFTNQPAGKYNVILINSLGQQVYKNQLNHIGGTATQTLQLTRKVVRGVYQLQVSNGTQQVIQKVVVD